MGSGHFLSSWCPIGTEDEQRFLWNDPRNGKVDDDRTGRISPTKSVTAWETPSHFGDLLGETPEPIIGEACPIVYTNYRRCNDMFHGSMEKLKETDSTQVVPLGGK